jgi:hypothetical protein
MLGLAAGPPRCTPAQGQAYLHPWRWPARPRGWPRGQRPAGPRAWGPGARRTGHALPHPLWAQRQHALPPGGCLAARGTVGG